MKFMVLFFSLAIHVQSFAANSYDCSAGDRILIQQALNSTVIRGEIGLIESAKAVCTMKVANPSAF
jgi:hypothetical protein